MISKELFLTSINALQMQYDYDLKSTTLFQTIFNEDRITMGYNNSAVVNQLIFLLTELTGDQQEEWISYFIYELDFGREYKQGCVLDEKGEPVDLSTPESLYFFLVKQKESC